MVILELRREILLWGENPFNHTYLESCVMSGEERDIYAVVGKSPIYNFRFYSQLELLRLVGIVN